MPILDDASQNRSVLLGNTALQLHNRLDTVEGENVIQFVGEVLQAVKEKLYDLEDNDQLGNFILRCSQELASRVGNVSQQIDGLNEADIHDFAMACRQEANTLLLVEEEQRTKISNLNVDNVLLENGSHLVERYHKHENDVGLAYLSLLEKCQSFTEHDLTIVLNSTSTMLKDIELSLNSIDKDDAQDIADAALIAADMMICSLQEVHAWFAGNTICEKNDLIELNRIEIISESSHRNIPSSTFQSRTGLAKSRRLRLLWPPLSNTIFELFGYSRDFAKEKPLLAASLSISLWPAAMFVSFFATPIVLTDILLQNIYKNPSVNNFPLIVGLETFAAQAFQTSKFFLLSFKLLIRKSLRVVQKQIERHGGPGIVALSVGLFFADRVLHPLDTIQQVCHGLAWITSNVIQAVQNQDSGDAP